jgi:putative ABC transport system ATP-binding protein
VSDANDLPAVEVHDVTKSFDNGKVSALAGVSLTVQPQEFVAITGPSGCGKSTLLHLLATLDHPSSGTVRVRGMETDHHMHHPNEFRRNQIGLVFQLHNLLPHLTAQQNIEIVMFDTHRSRRERRDRSRELLSEVQLSGKERRRPPELSGGERQRVAIARALANSPTLLLADEPTGALDTVGVERVLDLMRRLRSEEGVTIVMVTHDMHVAGAADRIIRMRDGRVVDDEPTVAGG